MKEVARQLLIGQFLFENEVWDRLVSYQKNEISSYKSRLAEITEFADKDGLVDVEKFQDEFLAQDQMLFFLAGELHKQLVQLRGDPCVDDKQFGQVLLNQERIRSDIEKAGILFSRVKNGFSIYLAEIFCTS